MSDQNFHKRVVREQTVVPGYKSLCQILCNSSTIAEANEALRFFCAPRAKNLIKALNDRKIPSPTMDAWTEVSVQEAFRVRSD